jgi:hypothetical protein
MAVLPHDVSNKRADGLFREMISGDLGKPRFKFMSKRADCGPAIVG